MIKDSPMIHRLPSAEGILMKPEARGHSPGAPNMNLLGECLLRSLVLGNTPCCFMTLYASVAICHKSQINQQTHSSHRPVDTQTRVSHGALGHDSFPTKKLPGKINYEQRLPDFRHPWLSLSSTQRPLSDT